ncbi:hypothetical protein ACWC5I_03845 [Kitasatospora sp. NPDC001574]
MPAVRSDLYRGDHHPQVGADILVLPTAQLQRIALIRISQLTRGEVRGIPLEAMARYPDLSDCRKLYFDEAENDIGQRTTRTPLWRLVYRLQDALPGPDTRMLLQVIAVGARAQSEVYREAGARLGRSIIERAPAPQPTVTATAAPRQRGLMEAQRAALDRSRRGQGRRR